MTLFYLLGSQGNQTLAYSWKAASSISFESTHISRSHQTALLWTRSLRSEQVLYSGTIWVVEADIHGNLGGCLKGFGPFLSRWDFHGGSCAAYSTPSVLSLISCPRKKSGAAGQWSQRLGHPLPKLGRMKDFRIQPNWQMDRYRVTWTEELLPLRGSNTGHTLFRSDESGCVGDNTPQIQESVVQAVPRVCIKAWKDFSRRLGRKLFYALDFWEPPLPHALAAKASLDEWVKNKLSGIFATSIFLCMRILN
jgi:hypothetical protein